MEQCMIKDKVLSRGPAIDTQVCVERAGGNRFDMVLIATQRAREIKRKNENSDKREHVYSIITALQELQDGEYGKEYLDKLRKK